MVQIIRPDGSLVLTGVVSGTHTAVNSVSANDATKIYTDDGIAAEIDFSLGSPVGTPADGNVTLRYRHGRTYQGNLASATHEAPITAELVSGAGAVLASETINPTNAWTTRSFVANLGAVSDWAGLHVRFTTPGHGGKPADRRGFALTWVELQVSDAPAVTPIYRGSRGRASVYRGVRTDAVMYRGAKALF